MENFGIDSMAFVYCHTNKINGKKYVGQTCRTPRERWKNGFGYKGSTYFYSAIQKYGWNNFDHEILCVVPESFADTMEKYFIKYYNTTDQIFGYNLENGGNKEKHLAESTKRKLREIETNRVLSIEWKHHLSESLKGNNNAIKKSVVCLETGIVYCSIRDASQKLNINHTVIMRCCNHNKHYNSAGGFHFVFSDEYNTLSNDLIKNKLLFNANDCKKPVICLENKHMYESAADASRKLNISRSHISACCNHLKYFRSAGGLHFEFYNIKEAN